MVLGEKVKKLIETNGYSVNKMAKEIGIANTYMYKIVKMESIDTKYLVKIASVLNIPVTAFFAEDEVFKGDSSSMLKNMEPTKNESGELNEILNLNSTIEVLKKFIQFQGEEIEDLKYELEEIMKLAGPDFKNLESYFDKKELEDLRSKLLRIRLRNVVVQ